LDSIVRRYPTKEVPKETKKIDPRSGDPTKEVEVRTIPSTSLILSTQTTEAVVDPGVLELLKMFE